MSNILYISLVDWYWIKQRPQHFAELLSNNNNVVYISKRPWKENINTVYSHTSNDENINSGLFMRNKNLKVIRKRFIPKEKLFDLIYSINTRLFKNYLKKLDKLHEFDVIILTHPTQYEYIPSSFFSSKKFIYDCMDNYKEFDEVNKGKLIKNETKLIELCDNVIVSSDDLYEQLTKSYDLPISKIHIINNGVDITNFDRKNLNSKDRVDIFKNTDHKKVGYIGTISKWLDTELIREAALKNNNIDFYLVGPIEQGTDLLSLQDVNNVVFTGTQAYSNIPVIVNNFDVCLMPFKDTSLVRSVNPVKIYEYLALGKPVIALKYSETEKIGNIIYTYKNIEQFNDNLYKALNENNENIIDERIEFANRNTWESRVSMLEKIITNL